jgi:NADH-quinone oxidoreductase subunit E
MNADKNDHLAVLSAAVRKHIDEWIVRYPSEHKRSGVFEALRVVQEENGGFLTTPLMNLVADYLEMPHTAVYEVATFYSLFHLEPVGRHVIQLCTNLSCQLSGSDEIALHLKKRLNIDFNETTADGRFTLKEVECLGACVAAPVCQISSSKAYHENLTPDKVDEILTILV